MNGSELALGDANYTLLAEGNNATGGWLESDKRATLFSIEMPFDVIVLGCVCFPLVLLIGITGNMLVIYVMCKERDMRSFTNYLLANLSICDILLLAVCVPSGLNDLFAKERWYLGKPLCYLISFIENSMGVASILSILVITCERYFVICKPLITRSLITRSAVIKVIVAIWSISIVANLPFIFLTEYKITHFFDTNTDEYKCSASLAPTWSLYYIVALTFVIYFVIGFVLLAMYYKISQSLKRSTKLLIATSAVTNNINNNNNNNSNNERRKSKSTLAATSAMLAAGDVSLKRMNNLIESRRWSELKKYAINVGNDDEFLHRQSIAQLYVASPRSCRENGENGDSDGGGGGGGGSGSCGGSTERINSSSNISLTLINNNLEKYLKPRRQLIYMLMCVIIAFYICLLPLKIWTLVLAFFAHRAWFPRVINLRTYWHINIACRTLFYANSSINPLLYNCLSKKFRAGFRRLAIVQLLFNRKSANKECADNMLPLDTAIITTSCK